VDNELIERALANLVDNALKFCPAGGRITLIARAAASVALKVCLSVRDSGPGIALAAISPTCLTGSTRARAIHRPQPPARAAKGLGLAIVKRIAELHGGTVTLESDAGRGTCVTLVLPGIQGANPL
jgi:signal transduction histidine kinase